MREPFLAVRARPLGIRLTMAPPGQVPQAVLALEPPIESPREAKSAQSLASLSGLLLR